MSSRDPAAPMEVRMPDPMAPQVLMQEVPHQHLFDQFWLSVLFVIPMVLVARAAVAGSARRNPDHCHLRPADGIPARGNRCDGTGPGGLPDARHDRAVDDHRPGRIVLRRRAGVAPQHREDPRARGRERRLLDGADLFGTRRTQLVFIARAFFMLLASKR
jgi:hypothetical protein